MHVGRHLLCILTATVMGAAVGSLLLGIGIGVVGVFTVRHDYFGAGWMIGGGLLFGVLAFVYAFIPVAIVSAILGPVLLPLSRRGGDVSVPLFFGLVTGVVTLPWLLFGGGYGLFGSAAMLLTYGYPAAATYLFTWRNLSRSPPPTDVSAAVARAMPQ